MAQGTSLSPKKRAVNWSARKVRDNLELYSILAPVIVLIFIFAYIPLYGIVIAFQDYFPGMPFIGEGVEWVGLKHFKAFVTSFYFGRILKNTIVLSLMHLCFGFWIPIFFALLLNEMDNARLKKVIQTVSYMPHFVSSVVVAGMVVSFIAPDGIVVMIAESLGIQVRALNTSQKAFPWIYTITNVWKSFGWSSILYLSSISSIDPTLYEAADIDGASRIQRMIHITVPFMVPLIMIQLIFAVSGLLNSNTEMILLLYNPSVYATADVIGTYVYREGLVGGRFSYGSAVGLMMSVIGYLLVYVANAISRKLTDYSLW